MATVALMFPLLHKFRALLFDTDREIIENRKVQFKGYINLIDLQIEAFKAFKLLKPEENSINKLLSAKTEYEKAISSLETNPELYYQLSSPITQIFYTTKKRIKWCLLMIILMFLFNSVFFNSPIFSNFIHDNCNIISNLHGWKDDISTFINITTLTCQLYFLYRLIIDSVDLFIRVNTPIKESNNSLKDNLTSSDIPKADDGDASNP